MVFLFFVMLALVVSSFSCSDVGSIFLLHRCNGVILRSNRLAIYNDVMAVKKYCALYECSHPLNKCQGHEVMKIICYMCQCREERSIGAGNNWTPTPFFSVFFFVVVVVVSVFFCCCCCFSVFLFHYCIISH